MAPGSFNKFKRFCKWGHLFDEENTLYAYGKRYCLECRRRRWTAQNKKRREQKLLDMPKGSFQSSKTHCAHGHPYDAHNTRWRGNRRDCKECQRRRNAEAAERKRGYRSDPNDSAVKLFREEAAKRNIKLEKCA